MGIQSFVPSSGGGMPGASYIGSIQMTTYNRSWTQAGGPGDYVLVSNKLSNGYAYFISGGTTTGVPLGNVINLSGGFTRIDIVAPKDDYIMLYKVATKTTTVFNNPFSGFASFPSIITSSGNFVLPNNALPLVNCLIVGGGGGGYHHSGGGGGGNVITLTAYQAVGTTSVTVGAASGRNAKAGDTYFGNVYALGGGGCGPDNGNGVNGGSGGGACNHGNNNYYTGGVGTSQNSSTGLGTAGAPTFAGGYSGGYSHGVGTAGSGGHVGAGGGGAGGAGANRPSNQRHGVSGGAGAASDITGSTMHYGAGGGGGDHNANSSGGGSRPDGGSGGIASGHYAHNINTISYGSGGNSQYNGIDNAQSGAVIVRYYIP